jgi:riboflavin kinase/FMN adenylyltransferase
MLQTYTNLAVLPPSAQGHVVAIGNFDGVHLGHQAVLTVAARLSREMGCELAVLTFSPNPRQFFSPESKLMELTPIHARARYLTMLGVKHLYVQTFDQAFSKTEDAVFIEEILHKQLGACHVVVGDNFQYGHARRGDVDFLIDQAKKYNFGVTPVVPARMTNGVAYSSTRIRELLQAGDTDGARQMLGRPFEIEGIVERGQGMARDWGFPTANLSLGDYLRPKYGVYAVKVAQVGASIPEWRAGVANLGVRPTFRGGQELLEVHIFDFNEDLYDKPLRVQLWHFLREEKNFGKADALREQIAQDAENAKKKLA